MHGKALHLFENIKKKVRKGESLTNEEKKFVAEGTYYKLQSGIKFSTQQTTPTIADIQVTHVGHANEIISINGTVPLQLAIDPVNYQSYTDNAPGKIATELLYPRQTAAAYSTDEEPAFNVVVISHNHHDHMCRQSLEELAQSNPHTIYIVPVGDKKHMERFGLKNIIEFSSWDDYAEIELSDQKGNTSTYKIAAIPANHASNRSINDFYESLYMGFMIHEVGKSELVLCTGDTAVWDDVHFQNLEDYLISNNLTLSLTAIAHGPDRPRSHMQITHQSTADAVAMFARFQCMNMKARQHREQGLQASLELLKESSAYGVGYHQGCYRLGLLSLSDVDSTLIRMLSVLESLKNCQSLSLLVNQEGAANELLENNLQYALLDDFEKQGLRDALRTYNNTEIGMTPLDVKELLCTYLTIPSPGDCTDLSLDKPHLGFTYDYQKVILNRNPNFNAAYDTKRAYEKFARLDPGLYLNKNFDADVGALKDLINTVFKLYTKSSINKNMTAFLEALPDNCEDIKKNLSQFFKDNLPSQNEGIRDESNHHTLMVILAGLIDDLDGFRKQFSDVHEKGYKLLNRQSFIANKDSKKGCNPFADHSNNPSI